MMALIWPLKKKKCDICCIIVNWLFHVFNHYLLLSSFLLFKKSCNIKKKKKEKKEEMYEIVKLIFQVANYS